MKGALRTGHHIYLYVDGSVPHLSIQEIGRYIRRWIAGRAIDFRGNFFRHHFGCLGDEQRQERVRSVAGELALLRVRDPMEVNMGDRRPMEGEVRYERRRIECEDFRSFGMVYDGFGLQRVFSNLISEDERHLDHCHIIFTNQLLGTWDENDCRYHARVSIYGFPSIISTTGVVVAPAKSPEFYLKRRLGIPLETLKNEFRGSFIDHGDTRLPEILKGYTIQALVFHMTGDPFCNDPDCRLYNAHWQEDLIRSQLGGNYEFCTFHREFLNQLARDTEAG